MLLNKLFFIIIQIGQGLNIVVVLFLFLDDCNWHINGWPCRKIRQYSISGNIKETKIFYSNHFTIDGLIVFQHG